MTGYGATNVSNQRFDREDPRSSAFGSSDFRRSTPFRCDPNTCFAPTNRLSALQTQVNRWVWRLLGADPDLNDIVQQVFVRIFRAGTRLRETHKLATWVHAVHREHGAR